MLLATNLKRRPQTLKGWLEEGSEDEVEVVGGYGWITERARNFGDDEATQRLDPRIGAQQHFCTCLHF